MKLYSAADLHSNNHFLTIIDEQDKRVLQKRLPNDLAVTLRTLEPYRAELVKRSVPYAIYYANAGGWCISAPPMYSRPKARYGGTPLSEYLAK
jgi:hypothetical protein